MFYYYTITSQKNGKKYFCSAVGENHRSAINHHNFWCTDDEKIGTANGYELLSIKSNGKYPRKWGFPYTLEDAISTAQANKEDAVRKIIDKTKSYDFDDKRIGVAYLQDFKDMITAVYSHPSFLGSLDTFVRDQFCDIILGKDYAADWSGTNSANK